MSDKAALEVSTYVLWRDGRKKVMATQVKVGKDEYVRFNEKLSPAEAIRRATAQEA